MTVIQSLEEAAAQFKQSVVAVGNFDGMHLGHRAIIEKARERGKALNCPCLIITFDPHPQHVIGRQPPLGILTPTDTKLKLLEQYGVDAVLMIPFTLEFARIDAETYIQEVYKKALDIQEIIVGFSHNFGKHGAGDGATLEAAAIEHGFKTHIIPPLHHGEDRVNSSRIRSLITSGDVHKASLLLGYAYNLSGTVVHGAGRGTQLQFPTANLDINAPYPVIPRRGVYAVTLEIDGVQLLGVMNIGIRPTFGASREFYEVHIINFDGDIYQINLTVHFVQRIRDEIRFNSVQDLKKQITQDVEQTREILSTFSVKE